MAAGDKIKIANAAWIAKEFPSGTPYSAGSYFTYNGKLYRATDEINTNEPLVPGNNCEEAEIGEELRAEKSLSENALEFTSKRTIVRKIEENNTYARAYSAGEYFLRRIGVMDYPTSETAAFYALHRTTQPVAQGDAITTGTNCESVQVAEELVLKTPVVGKGVNLLDNWYFVGGGTANAFPINQRKNTSYSNVGEFIFDRWKLVSGSVTITSSGITLNGTIQQTREQPIGQTVVASALCSDGTMLTPTYNDSTKVFTLTASNKTIVAAKLELGDTQTLARQVNGNWVLNDPPPNYQQELAKCQRYFQRLEGYNYATAWIVAVSNNEQKAYCAVPLPTTLRKISGTPAVNVITKGNLATVKGSKSITSAASLTWMENGINTMLAITTPDSDLANTPACWTNFTIEISIEL